MLKKTYIPFKAYNDQDTTFNLVGNINICMSTLFQLLLFLMITTILIKSDFVFKSCENLNINNVML